MAILNLLHEARAAGLKLSVQADRLKIRGPRSAARLAQALGARKEEVIAILDVVSALAEATPLTALPPGATQSPDEQLRRNSRAPKSDNGLPFGPGSRDSSGRTGRGTHATVEHRPNSVHPWRRILPSWTDEGRERWGRRANELAEQGVPFPEDERQAFAEVAAQLDAEIQGIRESSPAPLAPQEVPAHGAAENKDLSKSPRASAIPERERAREFSRQKHLWQNPPSPAQCALTFHRSV